MKESTVKKHPHKYGYIFIDKHAYGGGPIDTGSVSVNLRWKEACTGNGDLSIGLVVECFGGNHESRPPTKESVDAYFDWLKEMFMDACALVEK